MAVSYSIILCRTRRTALPTNSNSALLVIWLFLTGVPSRILTEPLSNLTIFAPTASNLISSFSALCSHAVPGSTQIIHYPSLAL
ncbi:hypothetical protein M405DRAFT_816883 [Rhizopogon salebrosus TDB-379]|nr:hypothetical protein M405DRAFT_816883 [Rhizopogon salebrosus TDB-379]